MERLLTPLVAELVTKWGYLPPLDVMLVDSENHLVVSVGVNASGVFRNLADCNTLLNATLPMTATVTDSNGRTWSGSRSATY
jgi:hypothetical protein